MYAPDKHAMKVGIIINYLDIDNINIHDCLLLYYNAVGYLVDTKGEN